MLTPPIRAALMSSSAVLLFLPSYASAQTTVEDESTTALQTSSAGDITIEEDASLEVDGSDPLTLNTDNTISIEDGAIVVGDDADNRSGLVITSGTDGTFYSEGAIYVIEDFVPDDDDNSGTPDAEIAEASDRSGILVQSTTGSIENAGGVYVEGLNSYGIQFAEDWAGTFDNSGTIYVVGDESIGISTQAVQGDLSLGGAVTVVGEGTRALLVNGDISGSLVIDGSLTKAASYTDDDGSSVTLSRSALRNSSAAVEITGSIAGGILLDAPPLELDDDDDDEDGDGIDDTDETTGSITSYGEGPALLIGGSDDIVIGGGDTRDGVYSLGIDGNIASYGSYSTFDSTAVVIGGQGGEVDLSEGISVGGSISATTPDSSALALLINEDANVPSLFVSGSIAATITSAGEGSAVAVRDLSGTLSRIDNTGFITVSGATEDETVALDLGNNTTGVSIYQYLSDLDEEYRQDEIDNEDEEYDPDYPTSYTNITGDIITGSGDDLLDIASGTISGDTYLNGGSDTVNLYGDSRYVGDISSGTGDFLMSVADNAKFTGAVDVGDQVAEINVSDTGTFIGSTANASQLTINVDGGLVEAAAGETINFQELNVGADGSIGIDISDGDDGTVGFVGDTVNFADGASIEATADTVIDVEGTYTVLNANDITGYETLTLGGDELPLIYGAELDASSTTVTLDLYRKDASELGLTAPQSAAYEAIIATSANNEYLESSILQAEDMADLQGQFDAMLPDYSGGVFDLVTRSSRLAGKQIAEDKSIFDEWSGGFWLEGMMLRGSKDYTDTADFQTSAYGINGWYEQQTGIGSVGVSLGWTTGTVDTGDYQETDVGLYEIAAHWRRKSGPLLTFARASYIRASMDAENTFSGTIDDTDFSYSTIGDWSGNAFSVMAGASYDIEVDKRFSLAPKVVLDYYSLHEDGYEQTSDTDALALIVDSRKSDAMSTTGSLVASYRLQNQAASERPLTLQFEGGYRSVLGGSLGSTVAYFEDGDSFTLTPDALEGGWSAEARVLSGAWDHTWQVGVGAEQTAGDIDLSVRIGLNIGF